VATYYRYSTFTSYGDVFFVYNLIQFRRSVSRTDRMCMQIHINVRFCVRRLIYEISQLPVCFLIAEFLDKGASSYILSSARSRWGQMKALRVEGHFAYIAHDITAFTTQPTAYYQENWLAYVRRLEHLCFHCESPSNIYTLQIALELKRM
jgi:hypothetical protein